MIFKYGNVESLGQHVRVTTFVGEDKDHLAFAGKVVFRNNEWEFFKNAMKDIPCVLVEDSNG